MPFTKIVALAGLCHGVTLDHDEFAVNVSPSQVDVKTAQFVDTTPKDILELVEEDTKEKPYLKYYYSSQKFVPMQELNVVYLNGIKFHEQGSESQPETTSWWKADTRSANKVQCEGRLDQKLYQMEHRLDKNPSTPLTSTMANDFVSFTDSDTVSDYDNYMNLEFTGRRRGGPTPKRKGAKQAVPQNTFDFARTGGNLLSASGIDLAALFGDDLAPITDTVTTSTSQSTTDSTTDQTTLSTTSDSPVVIQTKYPKIGCCNGVPYNSSKRCCCRRVAFDKDSKFCCAINGCEKFKVFEKSDPKNYDLCRGLSGLVVQEYGYRGLNDNEPNMAKRVQRPTV